MRVGMKLIVLFRMGIMRVSNVMLGIVWMILMKDSSGFFN